MPARKPPPGRHPDLDARFEENKRLIFKMANDAARRFGGQAGDYVGSLTIRLNWCLHLFKPKLGFKFSTYFMQRWQSYLWRVFIRRESEAKAMGYRHRSRESLGHVEDEPRVCNENDLKDDAPLSSFAAPEPVRPDFDRETWALLTKHVPRLWESILMRRFRDGWTLKEIGLENGVTRERVRQIVVKALAKIKTYLPARVAG